MVVETGSLTQAAERLGIAVSAVSRRSEGLSSLGAPLIQRTTRRMYSTRSARAFMNDVRPCLMNSKRHSKKCSIRGGSAACCGSDAAFFWRVAHVLGHCRFMHAHPDVRIDMDLSDKRVDLVAEGFDLAIRIGCCRIQPYRQENLDRSATFPARRLISCHGCRRSPSRGSGERTGTCLFQ